MKTRTSTILFAGLMPHPPIVVPGVGNGRESDARRTMTSMGLLARRIRSVEPDRLIVISPHSPRRRHCFGIWSGPRLQGNLAAFGAPESAVDLPNDVAFGNMLATEATIRGLATWEIPPGGLDHGAIVPLHYLCAAGWHGPTAVVGLNYPGEGQILEWGAAIADALHNLEGTAAILASGDMSHRLTPQAPSGYHPDAQSFDDLFVHLVRAGQYERLLRVDEHLQHLAGEDVMDPTLVALSAVGFDSTRHEVLSYEGPYGVGYCVAVLAEHDPLAAEPAPRRHLDEAVDGRCLPGLAREAVAHYFKTGCVLEPTMPSEGYLGRRAGIFVTIRSREGVLRGCIGSIYGTKPNLVEETVDRSLAAAFHDRRFPPLEFSELADVLFEVSVLSPPEAVADLSALDPERYGVVMEDEHGRRALMLPAIPSLDTVEKQLAAIRRKGGIPLGAAVRLQRFEVDKFEESESTPS